MKGILENLKGLNLGVARLEVTKIANQHDVPDPGDSMNTSTKVFQHEKKTIMYFGFKRGEVMVHGIPLSYAVGLSIAALGIAAWQYFT